ncbi:copper transporter [Blastococcus sp. PRF04-17]|nr:copper transporter [Blastococcus sp. PRF04-17]UOY02648.1 copper transporter [Blastococcus sp. PRF04-17]
MQLPETDDVGRLVGSLLAQVLMVPPGGTAPDAASVSTVLAGLEALDVLSQDTPVAPADHALVLTSGAFSGDDAAERNSTLVELVSALDAAGSGAVVAGGPEAAGETGLVGAVRADPTLSASVSTVDNVTTTAGQIGAVLAMALEREGTSGTYGTGEDTQPVPLPAAAP